MGIFYTSQETKEKISKSLKGKPKSEEHIKSARNGRIYTKLTTEQKNKISNSLKKFNVIIRYELIDNEESFIHYDSKLLKKYPNYE